MNVAQGLLLGALQGVAEWLPISSSGQSMLLLINLLHTAPEEAFSISLLLHLGSLFAVVYYLRARLLSALSGERELLVFLLLASLFTGLVGLPILFLLRDLVSSAGGEAVTMFIGVMLIATGLVLRSTGAKCRAGYTRLDAVYAGAAQGFSILPGISRSGTTIAALLLRGVEQETALVLSFLLAIPAILGALTLELLGSGYALLNLPTFAGMCSSFFVSLASMHYLLSLARKTDFSLFAIVIGSIAFFLPLLLMLAEKAL